eukprot:3138911-Lingulodinium_polyedra.AAC.1
MAPLSASLGAILAAQASARTELAPCGISQVRVAPRAHPWSCRTQAIAAPAATLSPTSLVDVGRPERLPLLR